MQVRILSGVPTMEKLYRFLYTSIYNVIMFFWMLDTFMVGIITISGIVSLIIFGIGAFSGASTLFIMGFYVYWFVGLFFLIVVDPPEQKFPPKHLEN